MNKLKSINSCYFLLLLFLIVIYPCSNSCSQQESQSDYIPIIFENEGSKIYGRFYAAAANIPTATVILLHGFPGGEGDLLGLGERLKNKEINALVFNFRGSWKSEGIFLPENSLRDVITSIAFLKSPDISKKYNIDTTRIILIGYSTGSSMALLGSLTYPSVEKIISISTTDFHMMASMIENNEDFRKIHQATLDKIMSDSTVVRSLGGKATHEYLIVHKDEYNLVKHAKELAHKQILLLGGWKDNLTAIEDHTIPFYRALQKNNAQNVKIQIYDTDHYFTGFRELLFQDVLEWIRK
ncbi:alpha/beta hydrolase family protein [Bacteroidota bacterium]